MELQKAEMILSEAVECYISNYPDKKGDIIAAIKTIGSAQSESAEILTQHRVLIERARRAVKINNAIMCVALRV